MKKFFYLNNLKEEAKKRKQENTEAKVHDVGNFWLNKTHMQTH